MCFSDYFHIKIKLRILRIFKEFIYKRRRLKIKDSYEKKITSEGASLGLNATPREKKIIVSLTSFPPRYKTIVPCLKSILMQTLKPDKVLVWLTAAEMNALTPEMKELSKYGVEFALAKEDLKPHKKYFYSMQEFPNDIVITVDDDVIYPQNLIETLFRVHELYPNCVVAGRVHKIARKADGSLFSYNHWIQNFTSSGKPRFDIISTGVGGVLYPPNCLDCRSFDVALIKKHCLGADDIWLKTMELLRGTKVVWAKNKCPLPYIINDSQNVALGADNVDKCKNDEYIRAMQALFKNELAGTVFGK